MTDEKGVTFYGQVQVGLELIVTVWDDKSIEAAVRRGGKTQAFEPPILMTRLEE